MDRVNGEDWIDIGGGKRGFRDENNSVGVPGTVATADWLNGVQEELLNFIELNGLAASSAILTQLFQAGRSQRANYRVAGGSANALSITLDPAPADLAALVGVPLRLLVSASNTGAVTLTVNGLTAAVRQPGGEPLASKAYAPGIIEVMGTGTDFVLLAGGIKRGERIVIFNTAGTTNWTVPEGVQWLPWVEVYGGGGGSGVQDSGTSNAHGEGGGGGGYAGGPVAVSPLQVVAVTVGGPGITSGTSSGGAGGTSSFGSYMSATGGGPGLSSGQPGAGGVGSGGLINLTGGAGYDGSGLAPRVLAPGGHAAGPNGGKGASRVGLQATWPGGGAGLWFSDSGPNDCPAAPGGVIVRY